MSLNASILLIPAAIDDWLIILNFPISPVFFTWVPPQSSVEKYFPSSSPIERTLTSSPYFSPNKANAPFSTASSGVINLVRTSDFFDTIEFTKSSILSISSLEIGFIWLKSNLNRLGSTKEPFWVTCVPKTLLNDSCNKWVAEWYALVSFLLSTLIFISIFSLFLIEPLITFP